MGKSTKLRLPLLVSIIFTSLMVFYSRIPTIAVTGICAVYGFYMFLSIHKHFDLTETVFLCSIMFIPTSTISIIGTSYSSFPLSWFHLSVIILFLIVAFTTKIKGKYFFLTFIFVCYVGAMALMSNNTYDAMKQVLTITIFLVSFIIGSSMSKTSSNGLLETATDFYIIST